jgi:nicotinate-nucleotide adenylyltransferase
VRLGLLGGTFDPPHDGHLVAAQEAAVQLGIERVLFLPARLNPLKQDEAVSSSEDRCRMVELAIDGNPVFELSRLDLDRPPPSYTVDLLRAVHAAWPEAELFWLAGSDILAELPRWHQPAELLQLAWLVAVTRPGAPEPDLGRLEQHLPGCRERIIVLDAPGVDISSTQLRDRIHKGLPIRYLTPPAVESYISERGLYAGAPSPGAGPCGHVGGACRPARYER